MKEVFETTNSSNNTNKSEEIVFAEDSFRIMGACFEVYNHLSCGFLERVYQEALAIELADRFIPFQEHRELILRYKDRILETKYESDFICFEKIIVEIKAVSKLVEEHRAQVHNYLKATGYKLGILVNFGQYPKVMYEHIVR